MFWDPYMKMTQWQQDRQHRETEPSHSFHSLGAHTSNTARTKKFELPGVPQGWHVGSLFFLLNICSYFEHCTTDDVSAFATLCKISISYLGPLKSEKGAGFSRYCGKLCRLVAVEPFSWWGEIQGIVFKNLFDSPLLVTTKGSVCKFGHSDHKILSLNVNIMANISVHLCQPYDGDVSRLCMMPATWIQTVRVQGYVNTCVQI